MKTMKALEVSRPHSYEIVRRDIPALKDDEVLVKIAYAAICASDYDVLYGCNEEEVVYPIIPGHEWSGTIADSGQQYRHLIGKKVTGDNSIGCGICPACKNGEIHICTKKQELGFSLNGAYSEYMVVPGANIIVLHKDVTLQNACLAEPLAVCLHALNLCPAQGKNILILGDGPIGLLTVLLAAVCSPKALMLAGHHQDRLDIARQWGATVSVNTHEHDLADSCRKHFSQSADIIYETTGRSEMIMESLPLLERGGALCLVGCYQMEITLNPYDLVLYEQSILGSVSYYRREMEKVAGMLAEGLLEQQTFLTHIYELDDYKKAFDVVEKRKDNVIKACFHVS